MRGTESDRGPAPRYFVAVAEELHFGRAAARLHMAQSPLSQQIRQLETQLGVDLINRPHNVVGLTDAGRAYYRAATEILGRIDEATHLARRAARGEAGTLYIGYVNELTGDLLPSGLRACKERFPEIEADLREGTTGQLLDELRRNRLDVAFVRSPLAVGDVEYQQLLAEDLVLAAPDKDLGDGRQPALGDLADRAFVLPSHQSARGLRIEIDAACRASGFEPRLAREANTLSAVLLLVAGRAGIALVPASAAELYRFPGVSYMAMAPPRPVSAAGVAWRAHDSSLLLRNFLDSVRAVGVSATARSLSDRADERTADKCRAVRSSSPEDAGCY